MPPDGHENPVIGFIALIIILVLMLLALDVLVIGFGDCRAHGRDAEACFVEMMS